MKKLSMILSLLMMVTVLASCATKNNEEMPNDITNDDPVVITGEAVTEAPVTEEPTKDVAEKEETIEEEATVNEPSTETQEEEKIKEWTAEATVIENEDGSLTVDYVLTDTSGNDVHRFTEKPDFDKAWYEMYTDVGAKLYEFADFNFDGYPDIQTQQYGAFVNQYYNIRIWNQEIGEFELNQDYMGLPNPVVNEEKEQIFTTNFDRGLGNFTLYKVEDDVLDPIAKIEVTIKDNGSFEYVETIGDGEGKVVNSVEEIDAIWDGYNVFIE